MGRHKCKVADFHVPTILMLLSLIVCQILWNSVGLNSSIVGKEIACIFKTIEHFIITKFDGRK